MEFQPPLVLISEPKEENMKKSFLLLSCLCTFFASAQNHGSIKGRVLESAKDIPIPFVNVYVNVMGSLVGTTTDIDGEFHLKPLPPGEYIVYFSMMGYNKHEQQKVNVSADRISFLNKIRLSPAVYEGTGVTVVGITEKPLINPDEPNKLVLVQADIAKLAVNKNPVAIISSMSPDVKTNEDGEMYFRGSRSGANLYYIDGIRVSSLQNVIPGQAIGNLAVYTGGIPAKYGDTTGGVVVIETQSYFDLYNRYRSMNP